MTTEKAAGPSGMTRRHHRRRLGRRGLVGLVVVVLALIAAASYGKDRSATPAGSRTVPPTARSTASSRPPGPAAKDARVDAFTEAYGTFTTISKSGSSPAVITLPTGFTGVKGAVVTATYAGSSDFVVQGLDASDLPTGDLLVDRVGHYSGTTSLIPSLGATPTQLKIDASGPWTVRIAPVSTAPALHLPVTGRGDAVYLYTGEAARWRIRNNGSSNFVVQLDGDFPEVLVNVTGAYDGTVPTIAGPSVVSIRSDGSWSMSRR